MAQSEKSYELVPLKLGCEVHGLSLKDDLPASGKIFTVYCFKEQTFFIVDGICHNSFIIINYPNCIFIVFLVIASIKADVHKHRLLIFKVNGQCGSIMLLFSKNISYFFVNL